MSAATMNEMERLVRVNREQADRIAELEQWQRDMAAKAAEQSLGGYREIGQRAAKAESERDEAFAKGKQVFEDLRRVEAERDALASSLEEIRRVRSIPRAEFEHDGRRFQLVAEAVDAAPTTSFARLKAEWQADVLMDYHRYRKGAQAGGREPMSAHEWASEVLEHARQAQEGGDGHH